MARIYYTAANNGTTSTTGTSNGINISFVPTAAKNYAIFHSVQTGHSTGSQPGTVRVVVNDTREIIANSVPWTPENLEQGTPQLIFDSRSASTGTGDLSNPGSMGGTWKHRGSGTTLASIGGVQTYNFNSSGNFFLSGSALANYIGPMTVFVINDVKNHVDGVPKTTFAAGFWRSTDGFILYQAADNAPPDYVLGDDAIYSAGSGQSNTRYSRLVANNLTVHNDGNLDIFAYVIQPTSMGGQIARRNGSSVTLESDSNNISTLANACFIVTPTSNAYIAGNQIFDSERFNGNMAVVAIMYSALSTAEIERMEGYYAHALGITARLPGGHTYKSSAPTVSGGSSGVVGNPDANGVPTLYITERFIDQANATLWIKVNEGSPTINLAYANNRLELVPTRKLNAPTLISKNRYNLLSNSVFVQIPYIGPNPSITQEVELRLNSDADANAESNSIKWTVSSQNKNNRTKIFHRTTQTNNVEASVHGFINWYKISEAGGVLSWHTSNDSFNWTLQNTIAISTYPSINLKNLRIEMSGYAATDNTNPITFDNLNISVSSMNSENVMFETQLESEGSGDRFWHGGLHVYTAPNPIIGNTNVRIEIATSTGTLSAYNQRLTILELTANDVFSTNTTNTGFTGASGNGHTIYNVAESITIPPGEFVIVSSASFNDNKPSPSAINNMRVTTWDATENIAYGYLDSRSRASLVDFSPYWYVGTFLTDNTRTYQLRYETPSGSTGAIRHRTILALDQTQIADVMSGHEEDWSVGTAASFANSYTYTLTPKFNDNYLVLSSWLSAYGGSDSTYSQLYVGGTAMYTTALQQNPANNMSSFGPGASKFTNGFAGVVTMTQNPTGMYIQYQSQTSGQSTWVGRKDITAISLGNKDVVTDLYVKTGGNWVQTVPYVKEDGIWQTFIPATRVSSTWRGVGNTIYNYSNTKTSNAYFALDASTDGITTTVRALTYGKDIFVMGGHNGLINTSTDGVTWTTRTSGSPTTIYGLAYGAGVFVAANTTGYTSTSIDGITWSTWRNAQVNNQWILDLVYVNDQFIAVAESQNISTSPDGVTWTNRRNAGGGYSYDGCAYGKGLYVVCGKSGMINTSTDTITWTPRTSGTAKDIRGVVYGNGVFVYVCADGHIGRSTDGTTWSANTTAVSTTLSEIVYGNGLYVTAGDLGVIRASTDALNWESYNHSSVNYNASLFVEGRGEFMIRAGQGTILLRARRVPGSSDYSNSFT